MHKVIIIDNLTSGSTNNIAQSTNVKLYKNDIRDVEVLEKIFSSHNIEKVFHLAANFANQNSVDNPILDLDVNGIGTVNLLKQSQKYKVKKFVYTSSSCVYGSKDSEMSEDSIGEFDTPYAITKHLGESYCNYFFKNFGLKVVVLRLFNSFGPGELWGEYRNVIPNFFRLALNKKPLTITGTGEETRDFTFVDDIVNGIIVSADIPEAVGEIINLGAGNSTTINSMAYKINELCDNVGNIQYLPRRSWDHVLHRKANSKKAKDILNWQATTKFDDGLLKYKNWIEERHNIQDYFISKSVVS
jgi:nucleoside-diphosphate-sugar epimerase